MQELTNEEWWQEDARLIGQTKGTEFSALCQEVAFLRYRWDQYKELCKTPDRLELLERSADLFFRLVRESFMECSLLGLRRMTDSERTGGQVNLTVRRLLGLVEAMEESKRERLQQLVDEAIDKARFAKPWRDKLFGHFDLVHATRRACENALEPVWTLRLPFSGA